MPLCHDTRGPCILLEGPCDGLQHEAIGWSKRWVREEPNPFHLINCTASEATPVRLCCVPPRVTLRWRQNESKLLSTKSASVAWPVQLSRVAMLLTLWLIINYVSWRVSISSSSCASPWNMLSMSLKTSSTLILGVGDDETMASLSPSLQHTLCQFHISIWNRVLLWGS